MAKIKEVELKVGDVIKVSVLKYQGFRGEIMEINNGMATVHVKTYYGNEEPVIVYQDLRYAIRAK